MKSLSCLVTVLLVVPFASAGCSDSQIADAAADLSQFVSCMDTDISDLDDLFNSELVKEAISCVSSNAVEDVDDCMLDVLVELVEGNISVPVDFSSAFQYLADVSEQIETDCGCQRQYMQDISEDCLERLGSLIDVDLNEAMEGLNATCDWFDTFDGCDAFPPFVSDCSHTNSSNDTYSSICSEYGVLQDDAIDYVSDMMKGDSDDLASDLRCMFQANIFARASDSYISQCSAESIDGMGTFRTACVGFVDDDWSSPTTTDDDDKADDGNDDNSTLVDDNSTLIDDRNSTNKKNSGGHLAVGAILPVVVLAACLVVV